MRSLVNYLSSNTKYTSWLSQVTANDRYFMAAFPRYILCCKQVYHSIYNDNFNDSCPIPVIFGTVIAE